MKKYLPIAASVALGLMFLMASVTYFLKLVPEPKFPEGSPIAMFMGAFGPTGYMNFVKTFELAGGILVMIPRLRNIGLLLLGPVIVNIIAFHTFITHGEHLLNPILDIIIVCALFLLWNARKKIRRVAELNVKKIMPILLALAFIAILFMVVITGQPDEFRITRRKKIAAPPEKIFPHVNDLCAWEAWSPWARLDPNAKKSFDGPAAGVGSAMSWSGNNKVGEGRMTITDSRLNELVLFRLEFLRPFKATNMAEFVFQVEGGQTVVTWSMLGKNNFMGKIFGLVMNCEKMVGRDYEKGLAAMKSIAETEKA